MQINSIESLRAIIIAAGGEAEAEGDAIRRRHVQCVK
jgi:hypothetical protein